MALHLVLAELCFHKLVAILGTLSIVGDLFIWVLFPEACLPMLKCFLVLYPYSLGRALSISMVSSSSY